MPHLDRLDIPDKIERQNCLNNLGVSFVKVYQLPYESIEQPEEFLHKATNALNFLRMNAQSIQNITVHVWISLDFIHPIDQRTIQNPCPREWIRQEIDRHYHRDQQALTTSNLREHLDGRSVSWLPVFDCFHCRRVCNDDEEQRNSALHKREGLETALCMWSRTLLLEAR